ncbi:Two-pore potassium channel 1 [Vitis vinifera]|uniref:Two-pore potassium channel 1 n=1 Tax=Vitis vinifera TaxID=29760 RepID=A0A438H7K7_VITVI|nr:Two-pore potassium channel 1 [Vitis vinifera]
MDRTRLFSESDLFSRLMADDDAKQSLLSETVDSSHLNEINALKRRKIYRCGSAPLSVMNCSGRNGIGSLPHLESMFVKLEPSFKQVFILLAAYLAVGTLCFYLIRDQIKGRKTNGVLDAVYFCVVTMTTVGYGDLVPDTILAKLLACLFVFSGMTLGGLILSRAADYIVEKQEVLLVKAMHRHEKVVEKLSFIDAFYCVCVTVTTLGYGDESFSTGVGRAFAVFWILSSTICLAQFFLYLAELYTEGRQRSLVKWVLTRKMTFSDLEGADLDHDQAVCAAEFILYKLKEMGKISQEDILLWMERFKDLDVDGSGTLTRANLMLSQ